LDKCPNCGARVEGIQCLYCGSTYKEKQERQPFQNQAHQNQNQARQNQNQAFKSTINISSNEIILPQKKQWTALIICFLFGYMGFHYLYLERNKMFLLYLFTFGFLGFGYFIDLFRIIFGFIKDGNGQYLV
jgi:hypothetical protein